MTHLTYRLITTAIAIIAFCSVSFGYNFVSVNQADVLVITHVQLRTPGWEPPGQSGMWETNLLAQKEQQGLDVALLEISDGTSCCSGQQSIHQYLLNQQGSFRYVLIIGDARRPNPDDPNNFVYPSANFSNGNIVPIWRALVASATYWGPQYICESDSGYLQGVPGVTIGRIPAGTRQEILDYVLKGDHYLANSDPLWSRNILMTLDDLDDAWNFAPGSNVTLWANRSEAEFPTDWTIRRLLRSTGPTLESDRFQMFEDELNLHSPGIIHVMGTTGGPLLLVDWYGSTGQFQFTNQSHLPFMLAMTCDLGRFDQYNEGGAEMACTVEKLILCPTGGIIAAIAHTGPTLQLERGIYSKYVWRSIFTDGIKNFGEILTHSLTLADNRIPSENFLLRTITLLGDPTLSLPSGAFSSGIWHTSESPIRITQSMAVPAGQTLTIEPGVRVLLSTSVSFHVSGRIIAQGTENDPIIIECSNPAARWNRLRIYSNDPQNELSHVIIRDADYGLFVGNGRVNLNYVTVENCEVGAVFINALGSVVQNCAFNNNDRYGLWLYNRGVTWVDNSTMANNGVNGIRLWRVPFVGLYNNVITGNSFAAYDTADAAGVQVLNSAAVLQCNQIHDNFASGLIVHPQAYADLTRGSRNHIVDNVSNEEFQSWHGQITLAGGIVNLVCGINTISDQENALWLLYNHFNGIRRHGWDATYNYWGTTELENILPRIHADDPDIEPMLDQSYECGGSIPQDSCSWGPDELMFQTGWEQERTAQFAAAEISYETVIELYPESEYAKLALDRIEFVMEAQRYSWSDIRTYFQQLAEDSSEDSSIVILSLCNAAWCLAEMEDYEGAYFELDSLLDETDENYEQITIALQRLFVELKENSYELLRARPGNPGNNPRTAGNLDEAAQSFDTKLERINRRVDSLLMAYHGRPTSPPLATASIPKKFALYQNYPNPFNPNTEIRFDLPEAVKVQIKIFNTLGQEVTTLIDEVRPADAHRIMWDSKSASGVQVAAGVYVYQIKAGNFVASKKMVLLR